MKTAPELYSTVTRAAGAFLLLTAMTSCELPPRDAWNIIQRDGLLTYWSREYNPRMAPSRYLTPNGSPFMLSQSSSQQVPYRPRSAESRYLSTYSDMSDRPKTRPRSVTQPKPSTSETAQNNSPKILLEPSKSSSAPKTKTSEPEKLSMDTLPYGTPVSGRPGMVNSPFAEKQQLVDVTGMAPGEAVKDPYTGKLFRVPPTQQAAAKPTEIPATTPEAPAETAPEEAKPQP